MCCCRQPTHPPGPHPPAAGPWGGWPHSASPGRLCLSSAAGSWRALPSAPPASSWPPPRPPTTSPSAPCSCPWRGLGRCWAAGAACSPVPVETVPVTILEKWGVPKDEKIWVGDASEHLCKYTCWTGILLPDCACDHEQAVLCASEGLLLLAGLGLACRRSDDPASSGKLHAGLCSHRSCSLAVLCRLKGQGGMRVGA